MHYFSKNKNKNKNECLISIFLAVPEEPFTIASYQHHCFGVTVVAYYKKEESLLNNGDKNPKSKSYDTTHQPRPRRPAYTACWKASNAQVFCLFFMILLLLLLSNKKNDKNWLF